MSRYTDDELPKSFINILQALPTVCLELQLVWLMELVLNVDAQKVCERYNRKSIVYTSAEAQNDSPAEFSDTVKWLSTFRNLFVYRGPKSAYSAYAWLIGHMNELNALLMYCRIAFDDFNEPMFYTKENEALYK